MERSLENVFLGADLGTSGLKLVAVGAEGAVLAESEASYTVDSFHAGWAETDPSSWVEALRSAMRQVAPALAGRRVAALGIDGQMHGLVLCDAEGTPCRPALLWPDRRAEPMLGSWRSLAPDVLARLANPLVAGMTGPMLGWLVAHEPDVVQRAATALLPKDFLRMQLAGAPVTERSDASATLLWDVPADRWASDVLSALRLPQRLLPDVVASHAVIGTTSLGEEVDGARDVPVVAGAADTPAALLAVGGLPPGAVQVNLGTGAQVLLGVRDPRPAPNPVTHLYADADGGWYAMAAIQNAGLALDRVRVMLGMSWEQVFTSAGSASAGAGGVSFLPFLTGERGGVAGPHSRGAWVGIDNRTTQADLVRAAVEAMVFSVRRGVQLLRVKPERVRLTGGGGRSPLVRQMLADLLRAEIAVVPRRSASAVGAALLAARGAGFPMVIGEEAAALVRPAAAAPLEQAFERWLARLPSADL